MDLSKYKSGQCEVKANIICQMLWFFIGDFFVKSQLFPFSFFKIFILRLFGARIGRNCRAKPGLRVKYPWKLKAGDQVWFGQDVWIDNLDCVEIGNNVCLSQGAYLCTGSHDWSKSDFPLLTKKIEIEDGVWIGAKSVVGPGVIVEKGAVLALGSIASKKLISNKIYRGNPAVCVKKRLIDGESF